MKNLKCYFLLVLIFSLMFQIKFVKAQTGWIMQPSIGPFDFYKIEFINSETGFITGACNKIFKTSNAGNTWSEFIINDSVNILNDIFFVDQTTGFIAGGMLLFRPDLPLYAASIILKTTNSGNSWDKVFYDTIQNQSNQRIFKTVYFTDENTGYAGGTFYALDNFLFKTTDGGKIWKELVCNYPFSPTGMFFMNNSEGLIFLLNRIIKTGNGGINWSSIISATYLQGSFFLNNSTGYVCGGDLFYQGERSVILKTTNEGNSWQDLLNETGEKYNILNSIYFVDNNTGYSVGSSLSAKNVTAPVILKTTNEGANWGSQTSPTGNTLNSVQFINNNTGFAVGSLGTILKTTDGGGEIISGITNYSSEIPEGFSLHQNYPNPFNPSTNIKYEIPSKGQVTLKIYNNLGSEVETLINEVQNAGSFEVKWNAVNQPSGIYYYKIQSGDFSKTMKMLLVK